MIDTLSCLRRDQEEKILLLQEIATFKEDVAQYVQNAITYFLLQHPL